MLYNIKKTLVPVNGRMQVLNKDSDAYREFVHEEVDWNYWQHVVKQWEKAKRLRVLNNNSPAKASIIFQVEQAWESYKVTGDFTQLFDKYHKVIREKADFYGDNWYYARISNHEFESAMWEEVWRLAEIHNQHGEYYLYETISRALNRRCLDVIRRATKKKQEKIDRSPSSFDKLDEKLQFHSEDNVEEEVTNKIIVEDLLQCDCLTNEEKSLLEVYYRHPGSPEWEIADIMTENGYNYYQQKVGRKLNTIKKKLAKSDPR